MKYNPSERDFPESTELTADSQAEADAAWVARKPAPMSAYVLLRDLHNLLWDERPTMIATEHDLAVRRTITNAMHYLVKGVQLRPRGISQQFDMERGCQTATTAPIALLSPAEIDAELADLRRKQEWLDATPSCEPENAEDCEGFSEIKE